MSGFNFPLQRKAELQKVFDFINIYQNATCVERLKAKGNVTFTPVASVLDPDHKLNYIWTEFIECIIPHLSPPIFPVISLCFCLIYGKSG